MKNHVSKFLVCALLLLALPAVVQAQFTYTINNGTITITGYTVTNAVVTIPDTITGLPVTSIGNNAFYQCFSLRSVTMGTNVINIGNFAFFHCLNLTNAMLPANLSSIGDYAFDNCNLPSVTIPGSVTHIGIFPFHDCFGVSTIEVDPSNPVYCGVDGILFDKNQTTFIQVPPGKTGNYTIPESVTRIGDSAFCGSRLSSITIPDSVTNTGNYAFAYNGYLTNIVIGTNVISIGGNAFYYCINLTNFPIPDSVTSIGSNAFYRCYSLASVAIGRNVTNIGSLAFGNCTTLTNVMIGTNVTSIGEEAFFGSRLFSITIPDSVTSVGPGAFYNCTSLTNVSIGSSVTSIEDWTFASCTSLTSVTIPNSVTSIGFCAFTNCTSLNSITIGANVASIDGWAFANCSSLISVFFQGDAPTFVACSLYMIFSGAYPTIYYVAGTAGWTNPWQRRPAFATATAPIVVSPPVNQSAGIGYTAVFTAEAVGSNPLIYQWRFDGTNLADGGRITGNASANLSISNAQFSDAGNYNLIVSNPYGSVTSSLVTLTVTLCPAITLSPETLPDVTLLNGYTNTLTSQGGTAPYTISITDGNLPPGFSLDGNGLLSGTANDFGVYHFTVTATDVYGCSGSSDYTLNVTGAGGRLLVFTNGVGILKAMPSRYGTPTNNAVLKAGTNYTITAVVPSGYLFSNWVAVVPSVTNFTSTDPTFTFNFQSNLVLTATFTTNSFVGAAGTYYGLFNDTTNGVAQQSAGFFKITTTSKQMFSGQLRLDGDVIPFTGSLDLSGKGTTTVSRNGKSPLSVFVQLALDGSDRVSGVVNGGATNGWSSAMLGDRAVFKTVNPAANFQGRYTMLLPGCTNAAVAPGGDGYGLVNLKANGVVVISGALGDKQSLKPLAASVSKNGDYPLYAPAGNGSIIGWLSLNNASAGTLTGNPVWIKCGGTDGFYNAGFTNEIVVVGSGYTAPAVGQPPLHMTSGDLVLKDGNLPKAMTNVLAITDADKITVVTTNIPMKAPTFVRSCGMMKGKFVHPATGAQTDMVGVYLQNQNYVGGLFKGTDQTGSLQLQAR